MASRTGDGSSQDTVAPKDRRVPLEVVVFNTVTAIPGAASMLTEVRFGAPRLMAGAMYVCPQPFLDPVNRTIWIEGREYPLERVHYWERAKMATSKKPDPPKIDHRIGKSSEPRPKAPTE